MRERRAICIVYDSVAGIKGLDAGGSVNGVDLTELTVRGIFDTLQAIEDAESDGDFVPGASRVGEADQVVVHEVAEVCKRASTIRASTLSRVWRQASMLVMACCISMPVSWQIYRYRYLPGARLPLLKSMETTRRSSGLHWRIPMQSPTLRATITLLSAVSAEELSNGFYDGVFGSVDARMVNSIRILH